MSLETISFMERFLSNNQDLQNIDFLNFDSNRIFFRRPRVNKAKSLRLDFDINLEHIRFDKAESRLKFGVSFRKPLTVNVYFFRKIEKDNQFGVFEYYEQSSFAKKKLTSFFKKFGFCFRPQIEEQLIKSKQRETKLSVKEESECLLINDVQERTSFKHSEQREIQSNQSLEIPKDALSKQEQKLQETKSDHPSLHGKQTGSDAKQKKSLNFDFSAKYSKTLRKSEQVSRRLLQITFPQTFFTRLLNFPRTSKYCPFILELVSLTKPGVSPTKLYILFEEKKGKLQPQMKIFINEKNRAYLLENIYDLSHEKNDSVFEGSPLSLKRGSFCEKLPPKEPENISFSGKNKRVKKSMVRPYCSICISTRVSTILLPCRHLCVCYDCSKNLITQTNKCPICRDKISNLVRVYDH